MRHPELGESVYWFQGAMRSEQPFVGIVMCAYPDDVVDIGILSPDSHMVTPKLGVRNVDDKDMTDEDREVNGGWDYSERAKRQLAFEALLEAFGKSGGVKRLEGLDQRVESLSQRLDDVFAPPTAAKPKAQTRQ